MSNEFFEVIQALLDSGNPFPAKYLHRLSDLEKSELSLLKDFWDQIMPSRKLYLLEDLINLSDVETLVNYDEIGIVALRDASAEVKIKALELLEYSENSKHIPELIHIIRSDSDSKVVAAALVTSAHFVYKGEVEEYPRETFLKLTTVLKDLIKGNYKEEVKQFALEALGYSSERDVKTMIQDAIAIPDKKWTSAALIAMGRSLDPHWKKYIIDELRLDHPETIIAAIKASGDMEISEARKPIQILLKDHSGEDLIEKNAAWALARIGGAGVERILETLLSKAEGEDEISFYEECLDEYEFRHDQNAPSMFKFKIEDENDGLEDTGADDFFDNGNEDDFSDDEFDVAV